MAGESDAEIYGRLGRLEQDVSLLKFRAETLDSHGLPIRVASLESVVKNISNDVSKIEESLDEMRAIGLGVKEDVATIKAWGKGVSITLTALVATMGLISVIPIIEGLIK